MKYLPAFFGTLVGTIVSVFVALEEPTSKILATVAASFASGYTFRHVHGWLMDRGSRLVTRMQRPVVMDIADYIDDNGDPRPAWFALQGVPRCSVYGNSETEHMLHGYITALSRAGNVWGILSPTEAMAYMSEDEAHDSGIFFASSSPVNFANDFKRFGIATRQCRSPDHACAIGGGWEMSEFEKWKEAHAD